MARPRSTIPTYRKHSATGRAAVSFYRADGTRTEVILPGKFGSKESKAEYERLLSQLRANCRNSFEMAKNFLSDLKTRATTRCANTPGYEYDSRATCDSTTAKECHLDVQFTTS